MGLTRHDFAEFFATVNSGHEPFAWQRRLLDHVVAEGRWPEVIAAPTGAGKSNVVDVHIFANALAAVGEAPRVPRRLATVVNRRALVDNQAERAQMIKARLSEAVDGVLAEVRAALESLVTGGEEYLQIGHMRGGLAVTNAWLDDPRTCAVITATPDMWGSRLLLRGYGGTSRSRPREAGLLAYDSVMVLDEAHLNRQLLLTARTIPNLEREHAPRLGIPGLTVVETTATPTGVASGPVVAVTAGDLVHDEVLHARLLRPKPVTYQISGRWPTKGLAAAAHIDSLVAAVQKIRDQTNGAGTIGCVVNRVDTAVRVAEALKKRGYSIECWVGRLRPFDLEVLRDHNPELFDSSQRPRLDVLVATQTVEVGVDLDLHGLVTELASGSALAQRAGRVNRRGVRDHGPITVVGPDPDAGWSDAMPYYAEDLQAASRWVGTLAGEPGGMSPWNLTAIRPPAETPRRLMFKQPELHDAMRWSATSDDMFAAEDLSLWLRDDLAAEDQACGLVLRFPLPVDDARAVALLWQTPPSDAETFPADITLIRAHAERVLTSPGGRVFLFRDDALSMVDSPNDLRPGDVIVTSAAHPATLQKVVVADPPEQPEDLRTFWGDGVDVVQPGHPDQHLLAALAGLGPEDAQLEFAAITGTHDQVVLPPPDLCAGEELPWLVIRRQTTTNTDETVRQEWTISQVPVGLAQHSEAVAQRAEKLGADLGLNPALVEALKLAGLHHDDGKADPRFQRVLGAAQGQLLAKSIDRSVQRVRRGKSRELPLGWRHEHLSVVLAEAAVAERGDADLILRLVGTSHGWGRTLPSDTSATITTAGIDDPDTIQRAVRHFDEGGWSDLLDRTHQAHGIWGCAYLEAILRAADCQVSREGS